MFKIVSCENPGGPTTLCYYGEEMVSKLIIVAVVLVLATGFYAYNLQLKVDDLEGTIGALGNPQIAEFVASIGSANYIITEQGQDYVSGSYFTATDYNDHVVSTPTIIFNCKYARAGSYAGLDLELERLDLKNRTCSFYDCELTSDEKKEVMKARSTVSIPIFNSGF